MNVDQMSVFLAGSILAALSFISITIGLVVINNILHKYWKPVKLFTPDSWTAFNPPVRQIPEYIEPKVEEPPKK